MPIYVWAIRFEADDKSEADEMVNEAIQAFDSVVSERLVADADD